MHFLMMQHILITQHFPSVSFRMDRKIKYTLIKMLSKCIIIRCVVGPTICHRIVGIGLAIDLAALERIVFEHVLRTDIV